MTSTNSLPPRLRAAVGRELRGEIVHWVGCPRPRSAFLGALPAWLMGLPWCALSFTILGVLIAVLFFGGDPPGSKPAWQVLLVIAALIFNLVFVIAGIAMMAAPFLAAWRAARTAHLITDKRLHTITEGRTTTVRSVTPDQLRDFRRKERRDGTGTLVVTIGLEKDSDGDWREVSEQLVAVGDVQRAEALLRRLKDGAL